MTNILLAALALMVLYFGRQILAELRATPIATSFRSDAGDDVDHYHHIRSVGLEEKNFTIEWTDDWQIGREFIIWGQSTDHEYETKSPIKVMDRVSITIFPTNNWFEGGLLGHLIHTDNVCGMFKVYVHHQIAKNILDEVRANPNQNWTIGIKQTIGRKGQPHYVITRFDFGQH